MGVSKNEPVELSRATVEFLFKLVLWLKVIQVSQNKIQIKSKHSLTVIT